MKKRVEYHFLEDIEIILYEGRKLFNNRFYIFIILKYIQSFLNYKYI